MASAHLIEELQERIAPSIRLSLCRNKWRRITDDVAKVGRKATILVFTGNLEATCGQHSLMIFVFNFPSTSRINQYSSLIANFSIGNQVRFVSVDPDRSEMDKGQVRRIFSPIIVLSFLLLLSKGEIEAMVLKNHNQCYRKVMSGQKNSIWFLFLLSYDCYDWGATEWKRRKRRTIVFLWLALFLSWCYIVEHQFHFRCWSLAFRIDGHLCLHAPDNSSEEKEEATAPAHTIQSETRSKQAVHLWPTLVKPLWCRSI